MFLQEWNIFLVKLLLQRLGGCRNNYAASAANCGDQVGERLARTGAGFHDGVVMLFECVVYHFGHFQLTGTMLVTADHAAFEKAARSEYVMH
jgi:hypothetical protein